MIYWDLILIVDSRISDSECTFFVTLFTLSEVMMALYLFALCNEIYAIAKNPLESKYNKRANVFHIVN